MNRTEIAQLLALLTSIDATLTTMAAAPVTGTVSINGITGALTGLTGSIPISGLGSLGAVPISAASSLTVKGEGAGDAVVCYIPGTVAVSGNVGVSGSVGITGTVNADATIVNSGAIAVDATVVAPLGTGSVASALRVNAVV